MNASQPGFPMIAQAIEAEYMRRTPRSRQLHEEAKQVMPGGDTRSATHFDPYPVFMDRGVGCQVTDVDENRYLDFLGNYTSLVHGHSHPLIVEAVLRQIRKGTSFASPLEAQIRLGKILTDRLPTVELVRFCNSGTEATMFALRAAKAFTGKNKIIKMEGGYHGSHDAAQISFSNASDRAAVASPNHGASNRGLFRGVTDDVRTVLFNNLEVTKQVIEQYQDDLAAVIVEPVLGAAGIIPATGEYLELIRKATRACNALMIVDEVITFRLSYGGAQELYDVIPDLTTLGKVIGGGFPIGAFGGRGDVMSLFDPRAGQLSQSGTFNGNATSMIAGAVALDLLSRAEITRINALGEQLRIGFREGFTAAGIPGKVTGIGSLVGFHFSGEEITDYCSSARTSKEFLPQIHLSMLNKGIFPAPRGFVCTSTPMTEKAIDTAVQSFREALGELKT